MYIFISEIRLMTRIANWRVSKRVSLGGHRTPMYRQFGKSAWSHKTLT